MPDSLTPSEARELLAEVEQARQKVVEEIGVPRWYWWSLAVGWIGLGIFNDLEVSWFVMASVTVVFGAVHAAMFALVAGGRHRTRRLSVSRNTVGAHVPLVIFGSLLGLGGVTVAVSLLVGADGAGHPATIASAFVALAILLGGPAVMAAMQRASRQP